VAPGYYEEFLRKGIVENGIDVVTSGADLLERLF